MMATGQNFAVKLCGILQSQSSHDIKAREWRLVGQEQDGSQLLTWSDENYVSKIGVYSSKKKSVDVLYTFDDHLNIIQASVNSSHTLLVYVVKEKAENAHGDLEDIYKPFMITLRSTKNREIIDIANGDNKQMMVQFLYGKSHKYNPTCHNDKFILFTHLTCIKIYFTKLVNSDSDDELDDWDLAGTLPSPDIIVKTFSWAQWDCVHQVLYYIHYRQPTQSFAEGEEVKSPSEIMPTLSALQFHADLPHETVLNIPLSLPQLPTSNTGPACGQYEDDPVPLRIHDCSLDLQIVSDSSGVVCICHHYLYKPLDDSTSSLVLEDSTELKDSGVNFAYSITLLHHGCVVHSVVPDVPWTLAKSLRPSFSLYGDNHLLVRIPNLYTHLLDVGLSHEPCCHIVLPNTNSENGPSLSALLGWGPNTMIDLSTLDIVTISVTEKELIAAFKSDISIENKISILHYFIQHECNSEASDELVSWLCVNQRDTFGALQRVMEEYLIATSYTATKKSLPTSALPLTRLLPYTQHTKFIDVKIRDVCISVSQEKLWNTAVVLLAPRQRVAQFAEDLWTRLWEYLTPGSPRFKCSQVLEKLRVSLDCYQPEALSRCTTPMSPCTSTPLMANPPLRRSSTTQGDFLPFFEVDLCTASKQEHIISVNLREMSMHLLRNASATSGGRTSGRFPTSADSGSAPSHVHAVATRWAGAQLEASRQLCLAVCRGVAATTKNNQHRGFSFIDDMDETHAFILFKILETYYLAADSIAFPLPQGFTSFFTYLGYRTLSFPAFLQYVHRNTFELQIDVMKAIIATKDDNNKTAVNNKLRLIQLIGDGRARRALGSWNNKASLQLRARDHAATLLSGHGPPMTAEYSQNMHYKSHNLHQKKGLAAFPSGERLSPLDTFLDLLTAKASLNELDFNLIIEATLSAVNNE